MAKPRRTNEDDGDLYLNPDRRRVITEESTSTDQILTPLILP